MVRGVELFLEVLHSKVVPRHAVLTLGRCVSFGKAHHLSRHLLIDAIHRISVTVYGEDMVLACLTNTTNQHSKIKKVIWG